MLDDPSASTAEIRRFVADISRHQEAAPRVLAQGAAAIPTLCAILEGPAGSVPRARRFAMAMRAAIADAGAGVALHRALHAHNLYGLAPQVAARRMTGTKNDAFSALIRRNDTRIEQEMEYGLHIVRLSAAVEAAGTRRLANGFPC